MMNQNGKETARHRLKSKINIKISLFFAVLIFGVKGQAIWDKIRLPKDCLLLIVVEVKYLFAQYFEVEGAILKLQFFSSIF